MTGTRARAIRANAPPPPYPLPKTAPQATLPNPKTPRNFVSHWALPRPGRGPAAPLQPPRNGCSRKQAFGNIRFQKSAPPAKQETLEPKHRWTTTIFRLPRACPTLYSRKQPRKTQRQAPKKPPRGKEPCAYTGCAKRRAPGHGRELAGTPAGGFATRYTQGL